MKTDVSESAPAEPPTGFGCPECGGALRELREDENFRFRCRVGHAFSPESLLLSRGDALEEALWAALRALEEQVALARRRGVWLASGNNRRRRSAMMNGLTKPSAKPRRSSRSRLTGPSRRWFRILRGIRIRAPGDGDGYVSQQPSPQPSSLSLPVGNNHGVISPSAAIWSSVWPASCKGAMMSFWRSGT